MVSFMECVILSLQGLFSCSWLTIAAAEETSPRTRARAPVSSMKRGISRAWRDAPEPLSAAGPIAAEGKRNRGRRPQNRGDTDRIGVFRDSNRAPSVDAMQHRTLASVFPAAESLRT